MADHTPTALLELNGKAGRIMMPNGCCLYWQENEVGGRRYFSDEIGCGVEVWDTALVDQSTLLTAMTVEAALIKKEYMELERLGSATSNIPADEKPAGEEVDACSADVQQENSESI
jgi:hypothetical protein